MTRRGRHLPLVAALFTVSGGAGLPAGAAQAAQRAGDVMSAVTPKPASPIAIDYVAGPTPALGMPVEIRVTVTAAMPLDDVDVRIGTSSGLVLNTAPGVRAARVSTSEPLEVVVNVTPIEIDVLELRIDVSGVAAGRPQGRHLSIPLRLGPRRTSAATLKPDPATGGQVRALPAQPRPSGRLR